MTHRLGRYPAVQLKNPSPRQLRSNTAGWELKAHPVLTLQLRAMRQLALVFHRAQLLSPPKIFGTEVLVESEEVEVGQKLKSGPL